MNLPSWRNQPNKLHVEGDDDLHSILHLLMRHDIPYGCAPLPRELPEMKKTNGVHAMLAGMATAVGASVGAAVGFVLDADSPLDARWNAVRQRLQQVGMGPPHQPPAAGFTGCSSTYNARVGVWLMPDNQHDGKLETFLGTLVDEKDPLLIHSRCATDEAKRIGAIFSSADHVKAVIRAWLAWQEKPGLPYGSAIRERYFDHKSEVASVFVEWFKNLYGLKCPPS